ncbi:MAG: AAA family ATPase [Clostridiales bacterium]|nr:AAA family ATPase [Clostridiales bacterium]
MNEKIQNTQNKLKELGYFSNENLSKLVYLFEEAGKRNNKNIPTLLLKGKSGAGKTFLAETFSKMINADEKFVQCFPRMGTENFQYDVDIESVMKQNPDKAIKPGILLQALEKSKEKTVVLVIDELDKTRPDVDSFLLDFLENGRLTTGTDTYIKGEYPIYTFITSNDKREIDDALLNRSKIVEVDRPDKELFLEILGLPKEHYLGYFYDRCPDFSIRQAKQYLEDLEVLDEDIDIDVLSQYVSLDKNETLSMYDMNYASELENKGVKIEVPELYNMKIEIDGGNNKKFFKIAKRHKNLGIKFESYDENRYRIYIENIKQLKELRPILDNDDYFSGWIEDSVDMEMDNIIWADNIDNKTGTKFGLELINDEIFKVATNGDKKFVYLNSNQMELYLNKKHLNKDDVDDADYVDDLNKLEIDDNYDVLEEREF